MRSPTIEIHGTGTHNRGAELMAIAIAERMRTSFPDCRIVVPPGFGTLQDIHSHGFSMTSQFTQPISRLYVKMLPPNMRRTFGMIAPRQVDIVLDASGFSFSDQWGPKGARKLLEKMNQRDRKHQPLVLLPQAFGPFQSRPVADATRLLLHRASLVYARDIVSLQYLKDLDLDTMPKLYPDFTLSVAGRKEGIALPSAPFAAIVPNARMLDKSNIAADYINFLSNMVFELPKYGFQPVFLLHDANEDSNVLKKIGSAAKKACLLSHSDPRVLKWILSEASIVVGSRFHALASALSQGTPCIGVGWSHKYKALFEDFGCSKFLLENISDNSRVSKILSQLSDEGKRHNTSQIILGKGRQLKAKADEMWQSVEKIISSCT